MKEPNNQNDIRPAPLPLQGRLRRRAVSEEETSSLRRPRRKLRPRWRPIMPTMEYRLVALFED